MAKHYPPRAAIATTWPNSRLPSLTKEKDWPHWNLRFRILLDAAGVEHVLDPFFGADEDVVEYEEGEEGGGGRCGNGKANGTIQHVRQMALQSISFEVLQRLQILGWTPSDSLQDLYFRLSDMFGNDNYDDDNNTNATSSHYTASALYREILSARVSEYATPEDGLCEFNRKWRKLMDMMGTDWFYLHALLGFIEDEYPETSHQWKKELKELRWKDLSEENKKTFIKKIEEFLSRDCLISS